MSEKITGKQNIETEESLLNSRELFKKFASHLQTIREEEKVNLSRELHDSLGQSLTGLKIYASRILNGLNDGLTDLQIDSIREQVKEMIGIIDVTLRGLRKIAKDLRPRILDEFGLVPAIEIFVKEFTASRDLKYKLTKGVRKIEINKISSLEVYRIIQETISHVICQSDTNLLTVKISDNQHAYFIEILDDASGQDKTGFFESNSIRILGLYERVKIFGGELQISVDVSTGVKIVLSIPKNEME